MNSMFRRGEDRNKLQHNHSVHYMPYVWHTINMYFFEMLFQCNMFFLEHPCQLNRSQSFWHATGYVCFMLVCNKFSMDDPVYIGGSVNMPVFLFTIIPTQSYSHKHYTGCRILLSFHVCVWVMLLGSVCSWCYFSETARGCEASRVLMQSTMGFSGTTWWH